MDIRCPSRENEPDAFYGKQPFLMRGRKRRPPAGPFPQLAEIAREYAGDASLRAVEIRTRIPKSTVANLFAGKEVQENNLYLFALGYGRPLNPLRVAMGLDPIIPDPTAGTGEEKDHALEISIAKPAEELPPQVASVVRYIRRLEKQIGALEEEKKQLEEQLVASARSGPIINKDGDELDPRVRNLRAPFVTMLVELTTGMRELVEYVVKKRLTLTGLMEWERKASYWDHEGRAAVDREIEAQKALDPMLDRVRPEGNPEPDKAVVLTLEDVMLL